MGVELRPLGVNCNLACQYCYQNPQRDAGSLTKSYDMDAMKAAIAREGGPFALFGGEPLLVPESDLEELWAWGWEQFQGNGIQTNGVRISDNHIRMFKQYNVHVGISLDGPGELNDARWAGSLEKTRQATAQAERAIERLCHEGIPHSLIVTLHRGNATGDKLPLMHDWFQSLERLGITAARLHLLEVENPLIRRKYSLSGPENIEAMLSFARLERELKTLRFDVFAEMERLLMGDDAAASCVWMSCDPYTTAAVRGVEGHGQSSNCGRTNKEGIDFVKADRPGYERSIALYHTPQEYGGCQGCRFFLMCKGQCPGTAIDGDWRNRSEHCEVWKALFRSIEDQLLGRGLFPVSAQPIRTAVERDMVAGWRSGANASMGKIIRKTNEK
jgi:uncharacterized protein